MLQLIREFIREDPAAPHPSRRHPRRRPPWYEWYEDVLQTLETLVTGEETTKPLEPSVEMKDEAPINTSGREGSATSSTTLEVGVEAPTGIEEDERDAAINGNNNPEADLPEPGEQLWSAGEDLFPHLDNLVSQLYFAEVVPEACRLIYHHYRCFLYPALFLALSITLAFAHPQFEIGHTPDVGLSSLISYAISVVLTSLAEVGCHQAVVRVYLRNRSRRQMSTAVVHLTTKASLWCARAQQTTGPSKMR